MNQTVMKPRTNLREMPMPEPPRLTFVFQCIYGNHPAEVLHRGTAYCRRCYDERNPYGKIVDP